MRPCEFRILLPGENGEVETVWCEEPGQHVPLDDDPGEVMVLCSLHQFQANDPLYSLKERT